MKRVARGVALLASAALALGFLFPVLWVGFVSLLPEGALFSTAPFSLQGLGLLNYQRLFAVHRFAVPLRNSLLVAASTSLSCVALGALAAYALARLRFRGKRLVLGLLLAVSMFPQISIVEPLYSLLRALHLVNSYPGLILPYVTFALPLTVFLLVSFFQQIPAEIEQAARLDGAGTFALLWDVVLPLSLPGLVSTAIISFVYCWNEFLFALSFSVGPSRQTLPVALALLRGRQQIPWGEVFAGAIVATLPVVILVLAFQRRLVHGLTSGGASKY